jgi:hypothetical protein
MKLTCLLFCIILILFSCGSNVNQTSLEQTPTPLPENAILIDSIREPQVIDTINKSISKTVKSIEFVTIDNLDITTYDLGFFDSKQAEIACKKLGDGWRLPTEAELNLIYEKNEELGEFKTNYYLGMENGTDAYNEDVTMRLRMSIINGEIVLLQSDQELFSQYGVRAVRDHKP